MSEKFLDGIGESVVEGVWEVGSYRELVGRFGGCFYSSSKLRKKQIEKWSRTHVIEKIGKHGYRVQKMISNQIVTRKELRVNLRTTVLTLLVLIKPENMAKKDVAVFNFTLGELSEILGLNNSNFTSENLKQHRNSVAAKQLQRLNTFISMVRLHNKALLSDVVDILLDEGGVTITWSYRAYLHGEMKTLSLEESAQVETIYSRTLAYFGYDSKKEFFKHTFKNRECFTEFYRKFKEDIQDELHYSYITEVLVFAITGEGFEQLESKQLAQFKQEVADTNAGNLLILKRYVESRLRTSLLNYQKAEFTGLLLGNGSYDSGDYAEINKLLLTYVKI